MHPVVIPLILAALQPSIPCIDEMKPGDLVSGRISGGGSRGITMSRVELVDADGEDIGEPALVMIFLLETEGSQLSWQAGEGLVWSEATGCLQPWKNRFQSTWNLKGEAGPPESWQAPLQFEALLDGRERTLQIGWETYPLTEDRTFVVEFDANLEATVTQTDAAMQDVALSAEDRELIEQWLQRGSIRFQRGRGR